LAIARVAICAESRNLLRGTHVSGASSCWRCGSDFVVALDVWHRTYRGGPATIQGPGYPVGFTYPYPLLPKPTPDKFADLLFSATPIPEFPSAPLTALIALTSATLLLRRRSTLKHKTGSVDYYFRCWKKPCHLRTRLQIANGASI